MGKIAWYNEIDSRAAGWLRQLIGDRHMPLGVINEQSIREIKGADVAGFKQSHFFAGIGGWPLALRLAGWPEDREVWTGSCPCQPFSTASTNRKGMADERHLWPEFRRLIAECLPTTIFGEQVASKDGRNWLDGVSTDLEALGYRFAAADLCAAGVGAPHIRQRLYWVAERIPDLPRKRRGRRQDTTWKAGRRQFESGGKADGLRNSPGKQNNRERTIDESRRDAVGRAAETPPKRAGSDDSPGGSGPDDGHADGFSKNNAWWPAEVRRWADGTTRRIESGLSPLAYGIPGRVGLLRGYGNAIVPPLAAEFVRAYLDIVLPTNPDLAGRRRNKNE